MSLLNRLYLILVFCLMAIAAYSQGPPDPGGGGDPGCWPPPCVAVPIDGGLGFLAAAGLAFFGRKLWNSQRRG